MALPATPLELVRDDSSPGFGIAFRPKAALDAAVALRGLKGLSLQAAEQLHALLEIQSAERVLPLGVSALDAVLPRGGLLQGSVIELQVQGAGSAATSFALCACRAAQQAGGLLAAGGQAASGQLAAGGQLAASGQRARAFDAQQPWCAFIDASASLFAPGVAHLGVELERLLVLRPDVDAIERVAIRIAEAKVVSLLVIDLRGALGGLPVASQRWPRTVRRLALAVRSLGTCVLVITPSESRSALPLPVAMRLEFSRARAESFELRVAKERSGRVSTPHKIPWSVFDAPYSQQPYSKQWNAGPDGAGLEAAS
jgi:RecA/RadA recombinase